MGRLRKYANGLMRISLLLRVSLVIMAMVLINKIKIVRNNRMYSYSNTDMQIYINKYHKVSQNV